MNRATIDYIIESMVNRSHVDFLREVLPNGGRCMRFLLSSVSQNFATAININLVNLALGSLHVFKNVKALWAVLIMTFPSLRMSKIFVKPVQPLAALFSLYSMPVQRPSRFGQH